MAPTGGSVIDLGSDVSFTAAFASPVQLTCQLQRQTVTLAHASFDITRREHTEDFDDSSVRAHCEIHVDFPDGVVSCTASVAIQEPATDPPTWVTVVDVTDHVLLRFDPCPGVVAASPTAHPPVVVGPWGPSGPSGAGVTRIHIADESRVLTEVGQLVKRELFAEYPPFTFNVVACCGRPTGSSTGPGVYGDPESPWFNVFFGIYQLDCAKADGWTRPFGYEADAGAASIPHHEDLVRLGKADWNWFSNYLYGVPRAVCAQYSDVDMSAITFAPTVTATIGATAWHRSAMSGIEVASCYQSDAPGAAQLELNSVLSPGLRQAFGMPCPRPSFPVSFIPTTLQGTSAMAYTQDDLAFHTLVFGGTSAVDADASFLAAQTQAAETAIAQFYPDAGFPSS